MSDGFCCDGFGGGPSGCEVGAPLVVLVVVPAVPVVPVVLEVLVVLVVLVVLGFASASDARCSGGWTGFALSMRA